MIKTFMSRLQRRLIAVREYRSVLNQLNVMSQRDLEDIGINRGDIGYVAQRAYKDIITNV